MTDRVQGQVLLRLLWGQAHCCRLWVRVLLSSMVWPLWVCSSCAGAQERWAVNAPVPTVQDTPHKGKVAQGEQLSAGSVCVRESGLQGISPGGLLHLVPAGPRTHVIRG